MGEQLNIVLVPHTHWDREWYQTFQQFRMRLVHTIDTLLDILDRDDKFQHFMLDGQTIVVDDYLEVRPEQEERLKKYTRAGRIQVGPWYLQPDEFLVSGESLIRNLQIGLQRAAEFGPPMRCGYVPDCFGHIAQLPQLLQGFGIDNVVFWRGVGAEAHKSEFYWAAPDGTCVLVVHLAAPTGYSNARVMPLVADEFAMRVEHLTTQLLPKATTNTLLFMNGSDHLEPQDGLPATIEAANALLTSIKPEYARMLAALSSGSQEQQTRQFESIHVRMGTLSQYVETIRQHNNGHLAGTLAEAENSSAGQTPPLQVLRGEMRSSQYAHLLPAVLSTRMWIKQQNTATEHLLEKWMEPLTAWAWKLGAPYPQGLVKLAWKYLLQNHPHDSICGCSIDQVHRENAVRFAQSQQVAEGIIAWAMQFIATAVDAHAPQPTTPTGQRPVPIVVFNPAPGPRTEVVRAMTQFSGSLRKAVILDEQGQHMSYVVVKRWRQEIGSWPFAREAVDFIAADLPAYGLKVFWMYPRGLKDEARVAPGSALINHEYAIENEWYHVEVSAQDGTLTMTDKQSGAVFAGLNRFVDGGDVGDLYTFCPPSQDTLVSQPVEPPQIEVISTGCSVRASLRISGRWLLPSSCAASRAARSERSTICQILSEVSLTPGARRVAIHTSVDNRSRDHRLRVLFPVPFRTEHVAAEGTFEVRVRPAAAPRPAGVEDWAEEPIATFPQQRFVDISNGKVGLGILNRGLPECEILSEGPAVMPGQMAVALTLLRCVEWLSRGDLATRHGHAGPMEYTPEGQCPGHQEFDYALVPHSGDWMAEEALVLREAQAFNTPVRALVLQAMSVGGASVRQRVVPRMQLLDVEPRELVVSSLKRSNAGKGLVVRVYNPLAYAVEATMRPGLVFSQAFVANLQEELQEQLLWDGEEGDTLHLGMRAGEITTIVFL